MVYSVSHVSPVRKRIQLVSLERLRELLRYDPDTGLFTILKVIPSSKKKSGDVVGKPVRKRDHVYIQISIDGHGYYAHQIAWYMFYGRLQKEGYHIDHINGKRGDNRIENLREVTPSQNATNRSYRYQVYGQD